MDADTLAQLSLLDAFSQPVLLVEDETVIYANRAAAGLGAQKGEPAKTYVTPGSDGSFVLTLGSCRAEADRYACFGGDAYIARQDWAGAQMSPDALCSVAQAIRAPLTNLFTVSSPLFLALEELEDPAISHAMASLNRSFYQLLHLMCNLSDAPAAVGGRIAAAREKTELCAFLQSVYDKAEPLCKTCGFTLNCEMPERMVQAWIDPGKLARAIYNLLANAMQYAPKGSAIDLRLLRTERFAIFEIHDSAEDEQRLSRSFEDAACAPSPEHQGAGFALSIARAIAQAHNGTLVVSAEPDGGTTAAISVLLRAPAEAEQTLHAPLAKFDYTGGYRQELVELADLLPASVYDSMNVN